MIASCVKSQKTLLGLVKNICVCAALIYCSSVAVAADFPALSVSLENPSQLRAVVGIPGLRAEIRGSQSIYDWDDSSNAPDDGVSIIQPINHNSPGRWQKDGVGHRDHRVTSSDDERFGELKLPPTCSGSSSRQLDLRPFDSPEKVVAELHAAIAKAAETGCPIHVSAGIYPINRDIIIAENHVTIFCVKGAVFKKVGVANLFWLRGASDKMLGQCEINGDGFAGSGLIIDSSAQDAQISGVYSHNSDGHGILNRGHGTHAENCRTEKNGGVGFANDHSVGTVIKSLLSRWNGNEGLTIDNPGSAHIQIVGGYIEGNCVKGGVGNIGVDAASDVIITGIIAKTPSHACPWNLTAQNNVGNTDHLMIRGGYFSGAEAGDIHFRTNDKDGFTVRGSSIEHVLTTSGANAILIDKGATGNSVMAK